MRGTASLLDRRGEASSMELKQRMDDMSISALVQTVEVAISNIHKVTEFLTKIKNTFLRLLREVTKNVTAAYSIGKEGEPTQGSVLGEIEALHSANTYIKARKEEEYVETRSLETRIREMEHRNSRDPPKMKTFFFS